MIYIGIGNAGTNICNLLSNYPEYKITTIDTNNSTIIIGKQASHQLYEEHYSELLSYENQELNIVTSCGNISGILLRLLHDLIKNGNQINLNYVVPDLSLCDGQKKNFHKMAFGILQGLAKNRVLKSLVLFDNKQISQTMVQNSGIKDYYNKINQLIVYIIHMSNGTNKLIPIYSTYSDDLEMNSNIMTYSIVDFDLGTEKLFFNLKNIDRRHYFLYVNETELNSDKMSLDRIKTCLTSIDGRDTVASMFQVFEVNLEKKIVGCKLYTSEIQ